jgi:hypothetical protein
VDFFLKTRISLAGAEPQSGDLPFDDPDTVDAFTLALAGASGWYFGALLISQRPCLPCVDHALAQSAISVKTTLPADYAAPRRTSPPLTTMPSIPVAGIPTVSLRGILTMPKRHCYSE